MSQQDKVVGPDRTTSNQVRQILMNELGLSREWVRQEVERIAKETAEKHANTGIVEQQIARQIGMAIASYGNAYYGKPHPLELLVQKEVEKRVRELLAPIINGLRISLDAHIETPLASTPLPGSEQIAADVLDELRECVNSAPIILNK